MLTLVRNKFFPTASKVASVYMNNCKYSTEPSPKMESVKCEEVRIPVPWGHIAGKWWGPQNKRPILVMHGWQDNCGSFDTLIPLLPNNIGYLAIDLPGHGFSSQIPAGFFYNFTNYQILVRMIQKFFEWPKVSLMGHSMSGGSTFAYTSLYPNEVDLLICIDGITPSGIKKPVETSIKEINNFLKYDLQNSSGKTPPSYSFNKLEKLLHEGSFKSIDLNKCKYILERNIRPSKDDGNKFYIARDIRLKCLHMIGWSHADGLEGAKRIKCPTMLTLHEHSIFKSLDKVSKEIIKTVESTGTTVEFWELAVTHHGHLNEPEVLAEKLVPFFKNYKKDEDVSNIEKIKSKL